VFGAIRVELGEECVTDFGCDPRDLERVAGQTGDLDRRETRGLGERVEASLT
jgi:hypothetical protein